REYEQVWLRLGARSIEEVANSPLMSDPESLVTADVLLKCGIPAALTDEKLNCLVVCKAVNLCLERGNCDAACLAYVVLSRVAIEYFRDYRTAIRFGQLGLDLIEGRGLNRFEARAYTFFGDMIAPFMKHMRFAIALLQRGFDAANRIGDFTFVNYA